MEGNRLKQKKNPLLQNEHSFKSGDVQIDTGISKPIPELYILESLLKIKISTL